MTVIVNKLVTGCRTLAPIRQKQLQPLRLQVPILSLGLSRAGMGLQPRKYCGSFLTVVADTAPHYPIPEVPFPLTFCHAD